MLVLMGRLILLLDVIKDTFKDFSSKEKDIIELYSKVDMLIIDDLGTERISSWALEKLYTIIENRNENKLPIIVTTRFDKESLLERFYQSEDEELAEAVIEKLYHFCYGIELKKYYEYEKENNCISIYHFFHRVCFRNLNGNQKTNRIKNRKENRTSFKQLRFSHTCLYRRFSFKYRYRNTNR